MLLSARQQQPFFAPPTPSHSPPPPPSPSSKTAAFFASPSASPQPPLPPDLSPHTHTRAHSLTADFFASSPPSLRSTSSSTSLSSTASSASVRTPDPPAPSHLLPPSPTQSDTPSSSSKTHAFFASGSTPAPARSLTVDFFAASPPKPTPPPSLRSVPSTSSISSHVSSSSSLHTHAHAHGFPPTSPRAYADLPHSHARPPSSSSSSSSLTVDREGDETDDATPRLPHSIPPPLARLFPSRYRRQRHDDEHDDDAAEVRSPRRAFVELDVDESDGVRYVSGMERGWMRDGRGVEEGREEEDRNKGDEDATPRPPSVLPPPLARLLFPSRYRRERHDEDNEEDAPLSLIHSDSPDSPRSDSPASLHSDHRVHRADERIRKEDPQSGMERAREGEGEGGEEDVLRPGSVLRHGALALELRAVVGSGAFSTVWRASIIDALSPNSSNNTTFSSSGSIPASTSSSTSSSTSISSTPLGLVVAVKALVRHARGKRARAERAAFQREVDVLQHLAALTRPAGTESAHDYDYDYEPAHARAHAAHPSLPALYAAFSAPHVRADILVLEYIPGGELLELVNDDERALDTRALARIWVELAGVVAWLHARNVVHRDVKLENVLLTTRFPSLAPLTSPILKLTDFGLARAIDPADPWLRTRCGSETYAAPELLLASSSAAAEDDEYFEDGDEDGAAQVHLSRAPTDGGRHRVSRIGAGAGAGTNGVNGVGGASARVTPRREGVYDGRETDAWALGVVLYALAARRLPFDPPADIEVAPRRKGTAAELERRAWVRRVLRAEVAWPEVRDGVHSVDREVKGEALAGLESVRRIVGRLLVRDPTQRASVAEVAQAW